LGNPALDRRHGPAGEEEYRFRARRALAGQTSDRLRVVIAKGEDNVHEALKNIAGFQFVDHVAIAVKPGDLEAQIKAYELLGFQEIHREEVRGTDQVREVLLRIGDGPNLIQLLEPLSADSPVQKLIERNGGRGGFAHIAFRVKDAQQAFDSLKGSGFQIIEKAPRKGSRGTTVFFVHPKSRLENPFGYLIEIVEDPKGR
jgi:methylmalonyl-CoA/ethylmalonyl-CoA epimerase